MTNFSYSAKVLPLQGKYYGTIVELTDESGRKSELKIWIKDPDCDLSDRELKDSGYKTREEASEDGYPCDCHYESKRGFWLASRIADAINAQPQ